MVTSYLLHLIGGEEGYQQTLEEQGGRCAICARKPNPDDRRKFHIDHDHSTGMVRGVLCGQCNTGLGMFGDDTDRIEQAIAYLLHWREEHAAGRGHVPDFSGPRRRAPSLPSRASVVAKVWPDPVRIQPGELSRASVERRAKRIGISSADDVEAAQ